MSNKVTLNTDNPARRLLHILEEGKKESLDSNCRDVWFKLLEVEDENLSTLMSRLGKVMALPKQIVSQVQSHNPDRKNYGHFIEQVERAFSMQVLDGTWREFDDHINEHTINYLDMASVILDNTKNTKILEKEALSEIREKINDLLTDILEEDIDEHFKEYIVYYLRKIIVAIEEYKISGATPIVESIEQTLGHSVLDEKYKKGLFKTEIGEKITTVLAAAASIVTIADSLPPLPEYFQLFLSK